MHYWNKTIFEGLLQLAEALSSDERLSSLAEYCRCRERGLRHEAFTALEQFLEAASHWKSSDARRICQKVLELHARTPEAHQFLTQPLSTRFVFPVLEAWVADEPDSQTALRWLGILRRDSALLQRALALSPEDVSVRRRLAYWHLSGVEHATHHLGESQLLGSLEATRESLAKARAILDDAPDSAPMADLAGEISEFESMLDDWESYREMPDGTFPEWCARRDRLYSWPTIIYYRN
jgi:hypothetical protein